MKLQNHSNLILKCPPTTYKPIIKDLTQKIRSKAYSSHTANHNHSRYLPPNYKQIFQALPHLYNNNDKLIATGKPNTSTQNISTEISFTAHKNTHSRAISLFRKKVKKNQTYLFRQKAGESQPIDPFMFSFYPPNRYNNTKKEPIPVRSDNQKNESVNYEERPLFKAPATSDSFDYTYKRPIQYSAGFSPNINNNLTQNKRPMTKGEIKKIFTPLKKTRRPCTRPLNV